MNRFYVRPALPHERTYVADWLPAAVVGLEESAANFLVAVDEADGRLLGVAVLRAMRDARQRLEGQLWIDVLAEHRRRGIGTALMQAVWSVADAEQMTRLVMGSVVHEHHEFRPFFERIGMRPATTLITFENPIDNVLRVFEPVQSRLQQRTRGVCLEHMRRLYDLPLRTVAEFAVAQSGGLVSRYEGLLQRQEYCAECSFGVVVEDRIVGLLLARSRPGSVFVDLLAVGADQRLSACNVLLALCMARSAKACGFETLVFEADADLHPYTVKLGARFHAQSPWRRFIYAMDRNAWQSRRESNSVQQSFNRKTQAYASSECGRTSPKSASVEPRPILAKSAYTRVPAACG